MSLCPEAAIRAAMTDDEFWDHVFGRRPDDDYEPDIDDVPGLTIGPCIRCGGQITVSDYESGMRAINEEVSLCDDCADDSLPDDEATL